MDPTTIYYAVAMLLLSYVVSTAMMPKPNDPKPEAFEDFEFPQADEGTPQAVIFGDCWTSDWTVLAVGNYKTTAIKRSGGAK